MKDTKRKESSAGKEAYPVRIFLSSSWEKTSPAPNLPSDDKITKDIAALIRRDPSLDLIDPQTHRPLETMDKLFECIDNADVTLCIFTKRHAIAGKEDEALPSPYVLSEAGCALGRYRNYDGMKRVVGFVEEGIDFKHLGMFKDAGMDCETFRRDRLRESIIRLQEYLKQLPLVLRRGGLPGQAEMFRPAYRQHFVKKTVRIYRSGTGIVRLRSRLLILDAARLRKEGGVLHRIWSHRVEFPSLETMLKAHVRNRLTEPVFVAIMSYHNGRKVNMPPRIAPRRETGQEIEFSIALQDAHEIHDNDNVEYQYAWSLPHVFASEEEQLGSEDYDYATLISSHGTIKEAALQLEFEREARGVQRVSPLSSEPTIQVSHRVGLDGPYSEPAPLPLFDENMWYQLYLWKRWEFHGTVRARWRPVSNKRWMNKPDEI